MKPRLTLVTHVDWGHVRQRPHQLALALAEHYDVTVVAPVSRRRAQLVDNPAPGVRVLRLWRMPGSYRSAGIARANAVLCGMQCGPKVQAATIVVVTSPEVWPWVAPSIERRTLAYDCMDDALAFPQDDDVRALKAGWERRLLERSDAVVCTSDELAARVALRGAARERTAVIGNGWDSDAFPVQPSRALPRTGAIELAYFGTIGRWLDFDALRALAQQPDISLRLIGPLDDVEPADVRGMIVEPPVEHHRLAQVVAGAHALLLPFRVDELTRAVDPVKLYEYIALGKPIVSSRWPALERFGAFVTFYRDASHLAELVSARALAKPPDADERTAFLAPQSWAARARRFREALERGRR